MILKEKSALVIGGTRGIGKAIALALAEKGINVCITYNSNSGKAEEVVKELKEKGSDAIAYQLNLIDKDRMDVVLADFMEKYKRIDIFINNAGVSFVKALEEVTVEEWDGIFNINLNGPFLLSQKVAKYMLRQNEGSILYLGSLMGNMAFKKRGVYSATKGALGMMAKVQAVEWAKYNIRVNVIAPSFAKTEMVQDKIDRGLMNSENLQNKTPLGRIAMPSEVGKTAAYLVSQRAGYITGTTVFVDGGWTAYGGW